VTGNQVVVTTEKGTFASRDGFLYKKQ